MQRDSEGQEKPDFNFGHFFRLTVANTVNRKNTEIRRLRPLAGGAEKFRRSDQAQATLKIGLQILHRFEADGNAQQPFIDAGRGPGFR